jgi:hypothetical protein
VTFQDLGSIGELIAAVATIATLVYLAAQIRNNTRSVEANSYHAINSLLGDVNRSIVEDPEVARIHLAGSQDFSALNPEDQLRFSLLTANRFRQFDDIYYHYRRGLLEEGTWRVQRRIIADTLGHPGVVAWWRTRASRGFHDEFVSEVESLIQTLATRDDQS